ncbi:MAG: FAD:protein FMN transferase [Planctomycetota bacterium]|jgi:thiamine biosynthesis lipoprotein
MKSANRRRFLAMALGAGGSLSVGLTAWSKRHGADAEGNGVSGVPLAGDALRVARRDSWALGSQVSIMALHASGEVALRAVDSALAELQTVEAVMSIYRPESQLTELNRRRVLRRPHPHLVEVLRAAGAMSGRTGGAFDVTVQPLWELYAEAKKTGQPPEAAAVRATRAKVDWRRVEISRQGIRLHGDGTAVTLNGIAQGFAADRAMAALRRHGVRHALVNTGEIGTIGGKTEAEAWTAGIQHPRRADAYLALAKLNGRCLATSGDYATSFSEDRRDNHLFDPRSGRSPEAFSSVSVAAASALRADALSTAVFVLGLERGLELVRSTLGADALFVLKDGRTLATEGFPAAV